LTQNSLSLAWASKPKPLDIHLFEKVTMPETHRGSRILNRGFEFIAQAKEAHNSIVNGILTYGDALRRTVDMSHRDHGVLLGQVPERPQQRAAPVHLVNGHENPVPRRRAPLPVRSTGAALHSKAFPAAVSTEADELEDMQYEHFEMPRSLRFLQLFVDKATLLSSLACFPVRK